MLTIGELAGYAGVTVRTVRHYHQVGLLPEPDRDASGYRRYGATAVVQLIRIRTLADAGVPLSQIAEMLDADEETFAEAVGRIDARLRAEIQRLQTSRRQIAQLAAGDSLALPPEVAAYLDRLRGLGVSERMVAGERDAWIIVAARWPDQVRAWMPAKMAELADPRVVRLYRMLSQLFEADEAGEALMVEIADLMAAMFEEAEAAGNVATADVPDDVSFDLLDSLAHEQDPRADRLVELMRERGWDGWIRLERVENPDR